MIRYADPALTGQLKNLWKEAFSDPDEFIELYFKQKYRPEITLVEVKDDGEGPKIALAGTNAGRYKVLSTLQMLEYKMSFFEKSVGICYISGAATKKSSRGEGLMRGLICRSFLVSYNKQQLFSVLIPGEQWLYGFYNNFGYAKCFYLDRQEIDMPNVSTGIELDIRSFTEQDFNTLADYYVRYFKDYDFTVQKTKTDLIMVKDDHLMGGGEIFLAFLGKQICGACFAIWDKNKNRLIIKEILAKDNKIEKALLSHCGTHYRVKRAIIFKKADQDKFISELDESGMIRIINVFETLKIFAESNRELDITLSLRDDILSINSGVYTIKDGTCKKSRIKTEAEAEAMSPSMLAEFIFGFTKEARRKYLYMNLMLN